MPRLTCLLCGFEGPHVRPFLVHWREPLAGREYEVIPRCMSDRTGCRARVEQLGESWPLVEASPSDQAEAMYATLLREDYGEAPA